MEFAELRQLMADVFECDPAKITLRDVAVAKTVVGTSVTENGNSATTQATIGERIDYEIKVTVPAGTFRCLKVETVTVGLPCTEWYARGVGMVKMKAGPREYLLLRYGPRTK